MPPNDVTCTEPTATVFTTETGSKYRVDFAASTIERLSGHQPATARVGSGARRFASITHVAVGLTVLIMWGEHSATPAVEGATPCTVTSPVKSIEVCDAD